MLTFSSIALRLIAKVVTIFSACMGTVLDAEVHRSLDGTMGELDLDATVSTLMT